MSTKVATGITFTLCGWCETISNQNRFEQLDAAVLTIGQRQIAAEQGVTQLQIGDTLMGCLDGADWGEICEEWLSRDLENARSKGLITLNEADATISRSKPIISRVVTDY